MSYSRDRKVAARPIEARIRFVQMLQTADFRDRKEHVQNSVETRGSPELVVYAAWA